MVACGKRILILFLAALVITESMIIAIDSKSYKQLGRLFSKITPSATEYLINTESQNFSRTPVLLEINNTHYSFIDGGAIYTNFAAEGKYLFVGYVWKNGSSLQVNLLASEDFGRTWHKSIDVWKSPYSLVNANVYLYIWNNNLFVFIRTTGNSFSLYRVLEKHTQISQWKNLSTISPTTIVYSYAAGFDIAHDDNYLYLGVVLSSYIEGRLYRYDGTTWRSMGIVVSSGYCSTMAITVAGTATNPRLLYFYARHYVSGSPSDGYVRVKVSTNGGASWGSPRVIMNTYRDYTFMRALNVNGTVLLFANRWSNDDISMVRSTNNGQSWSQEFFLVRNRGSNSLGTGSYTFAAGYIHNTSTVLLAYEGSDNKIKYIYSTDLGAHWTSENNPVIAENGSSYDPALSTDLGLLAYMCPTSNTASSIMKVRLIGPVEIKNINISPDYRALNISWNSTLHRENGEYAVFRGNNSTTFLYLSTVKNRTWYEDAGILGRKYYFIVGLNPEKRRLVFSEVSSGTPSLLPMVKNISLDIGYFYINISWSPVTLENYTLLNYVVYRGLAKDVLKVYAKTGNNTWFNDTFTRFDDNTYYYAVTYEINASLKPLFSEIVSGSPKMPPPVKIDKIKSGYFYTNISWLPLPSEIITNFNLLYYKLYAKPVKTKPMRIICNGTGIDVNDNYASSGDQLFLQEGDGLIYRFKNDRMSDTISLKSDDYIVFRILNHGDERINISLEACPPIGRTAIMDIRVYGGNNTNPDTLIVESQHFVISENSILTWPSLYIPSDNYYIKFHFLSMNINIAFDSYIVEYEGTQPENMTLLWYGNKTWFNHTQFNFNATENYYAVSYALQNYGESFLSEYVNGTPQIPPPVNNVSSNKGLFSVNVSWTKILPSIQKQYELKSYNVYRAIKNIQTYYCEGTGIDSYVNYCSSGDDRYLRKGDGQIESFKSSLGDLISLSAKGDYVIFNISGHKNELCSLRMFAYTPATVSKTIKYISLYGGDSLPDLTLIRYGKYFVINSTGSLIDWCDIYIPSEKYYLKVEINFTPNSDHIAFDNYTISFDTTFEVINRTKSRTYYVDTSTKLKTFENIECYYYLTYNLVNITGESHPSRMAIERPEVTPGITDLYATDGDYNVTLFWKAPSVPILKNNISNFVIYRGLNASNLLKYVTVAGNKSRFTDTFSVGEKRKKYYYAVSYVLRDYGGESALSPIVFGTPNTAPSVVRNLTAVSGSGGILLSWEQPLDDGGYPIQGYIIFRGEHVSNLEFYVNVSNKTNQFLDTNITMGKFYYYAIAAQNRLGLGPLSEIAVSKGALPPSPPMGFAAISEVARVRLVWEQPLYLYGTLVLEYRLYRGNSPENLTLYAVLNSNERTFIDYLNDSMIYFYGITAVSVYGESEMAGPIKGMPLLLPGRIEGMRIIEGNGYVELHWKPLELNYSNEVLGYRIYKGVTNTSFTLLTELSSSTSFYRDSDVKNGEVYYYRIAAFNIAGEGPSSAILVASPGTVPGKITRISIEGRLHSIYLTWELPSDNGGREIIGYNIYRGKSVYSVSLYKTVDAKTREIIDTNLLGGVKFYYRISALNEFGESALSHPVNATSYGEPGGVKNIDIKSGLDSIRISWKSPEEDGGSPIIKYRVYWRSEDEDIWSVEETEKTEYELLDLTPGKFYCLKVAAVNLYSEGVSVELEPVPVGTVPTVPRDLFIVYENNSIFLSWKEPERIYFEIIEYRVYFGTDKEKLMFYKIVTGEQKTCEITEILYGETYYVTVSASNLFGEGRKAPIQSCTPLEPPGAVGRIWVDKVEESMVVIKWYPPKSDGGTSITGYRIYRGEVAGEEKYWATVKDVLEYNDESVENGKAYYYRISAVNDMGEGPLSYRVKAVPMGYPSVPVKVHAIVKSDHVILLWDEPVNNGGGEIIGYAVYRGKIGERMRLIARVDGEVRGYEDRCMTPGNRYVYRVAAINVKGEGEPEDVVVEVPGRVGVSILLGFIGFVIPFGIVFYLAFLAPKRAERKKHEEGIMKIPEAPSPEQPQLPAPELQPRLALPPQTPVAPVKIQAPVPPPVATPEILYYRPPGQEAAPTQEDKTVKSSGNEGNELDHSE